VRAVELALAMFSAITRMRPCWAFRALAAMAMVAIDWERISVI
jgi:hypothetical protein